MDTGDILLFNYDCNKAFSAKDVLLCKAQNYWRRSLFNKNSQVISQDMEEDDLPSNAAFCFRVAAHKLMVVTQHFGVFGTEVEILTYPEFLSRPYIRMVKARQLLSVPEDDFIPVSLKFMQQLKEDKKRHGADGK